MKTINRFSMKRTQFLLVIVSILAITAFNGCKKSGSDGGGGTPAEENLSVEISPAGPVEAPAPGPTFPLTVTLKSKMPAAGIKIDVSVKPDTGGGGVFFTESKSTSTATSSFTITNTPTSVLCTVQVTVTSLSKPANTWTAYYKYSKK